MSSGPTAAPVPTREMEAAPARDYIVVLGSPIGKPQIIAALLLLMFLAQSLWMATHSPLREMELSQIRQGETLFQQHVISPDAARSPVVAILAALPLVGSGMSAKRGPETDGTQFLQARSWRWRARLPFLAVGVLLGASLWYVARRLYGNAGGYIALSLYAFSPAIIYRAATLQATIVGAWGAFGAIFTAIAVAHTLYAPREVVLWNWKRITLLGFSLALAVGSQFALAAVALLAMGFMLYLAPERRGAALAIMAASSGVAFLLLFAAYGFDRHALFAAVGSLRRADFVPHLLTRKLTYTLLAIFFLRMPAVLAGLAAAVIAYATWPRPRFFGVSAPLAVFAILLLLGITMPHLGGYNLFVAALPFAFVFIAGVFCDLLETGYRSLVLGMLAGIIVAHAVYSVAELAGIR